MLHLESGGKFCTRCDKFQVRGNNVLTWPDLLIIASSLAVLAYCSEEDLKRIPARILLHSPRWDFLCCFQAVN